MKTQTNKIIKLIRDCSILGSLNASTEDVVKAIEMAYQEGKNDGKLETLNKGLNDLEHLQERINNPKK